MMGKTFVPRPPNFSECHICHREFGSHSIHIHVARCLDLHRIQPNNSLVKLSTIRGLFSDDESDTSVSDDINISCNNPKLSKMVKSEKPTIRKIRRKRERNRQKKSSSFDDERPRTATLKRPFILDESLKDKIDMSLTKKEFMTAVKLCRDVDVLRGLPNMRLRAAKNYLNGKIANGSASLSASLKKLTERRRSTENCETSKPGPYFVNNNPYKISSRLAKRSAVENEKPRPVTTKLERPTFSSLNLPHILMPAVQTQTTPHPISNNISKHLRLRGRTYRSSSISSLKDSLSKSFVSKSLNEDDLIRESLSRPTTTSMRALTSMIRKSSGHLELSKPEKVPEPCRSCGRSDLPERFHTHGPTTDSHPSKIPVRLETSPKKTQETSKKNIKLSNVSQQNVSKSESPDSVSKAIDIVDLTSKKIQFPPKKMSPPKPWISPAFDKKDSKDFRRRSLSVDHRANSTSRTSLRPFPRRKGVDSFAMDEDGDVSTGSTSESEVVLVVETKTRNLSPRASFTKIKVLKGVRKTKSLSQDEEEMSLDDSEAQSSSTDTQNSSLSPSGQQKPVPSNPLSQNPLEVRRRSTKLRTGTCPIRKQEAIFSQSQKQDMRVMSSQSEPNTPRGIFKAVDCEICGKPFGRNSIQFHSKHCRKKFQAQKENQEQDRQEEQTFSSYIIEEDATIVPWNEFGTIWEAHMQQLVQCKLCRRKFFPDRIVVHEKSCKGVKQKLSATNNNNNTINYNNLANHTNNNIFIKVESQPNVEILLSSPMTIRRQLHNQMDAVRVKKEQMATNDNMDKSHSD